MAKKPFKLGIEGFDSRPTLEPPDIIRIRGTDLKSAVESARQQGYIESNVAAEALKLIDRGLGLLFR